MRVHPKEHNGRFYKTQMPPVMTMATRLQQQTSNHMTLKRSTIIPLVAFDLLPSPLPCGNGAGETAGIHRE